ncbi:enoyl-CoA hydratase [Rhodopila sp.]|jgi:enoyl-CoA hydratase|uniref:enoyl-CoA hydratase n=1 Tax=Rhodopila sp. TaxID=2480087 RepID=UPI002C7858EA|nr:enoyl-CoA hydratase [Rhodopila sp.]HVZ09099.1 enoyl-CoA hydratase [Rhodopila sp.]
MDATTAATPQIRYETPASHIARIVMARPQAHNAQGLQMTYELNDAFSRAALDESVKVIILAADGRNFSAGHDLSGDAGKTLRDFPTVGTWAGFEADGAEARYGREMEIYLEMCERWRNLSKPTIAQVQGKCIAGGLMLAWVCDLIIASDDATFKDPVIDFGICGVEFFNHPWELGIRKAKEFLFTAEEITAQEAAAHGMVNRVVPRAELEATTLALAERIAAKPAFALKATKQALNHVQDVQGRRNAQMHAFSLHHLLHAHNELVYGLPMDPNGLPDTVRDKVFARAAAAKAAREKARADAAGKAGG